MIWKAKPVTVPAHALLLRIRHFVHFETPSLTSPCATTKYEVGVFVRRMPGAKSMLLGNCVVSGTRDRRF
jgi:hypothetical protein